MRKRSWWALGAGLVVAALCVSCTTTTPGPCPAVSAQFEYKVCEDIGKEFGYGTSKYCETSPRPRKKLAAEPAYYSRRPLYAVVDFGTEGDRYTIALDESRGTRSGYDVLYIDANANGDLTDDPKVVAEPDEDSPRRRQFPVVELTVRYGDASYPYHVKPVVYTYNQADVRVAPAGYCKGKVTLGGDTYDAVLLDDEVNGLFNDVYAEPKGQGSRDYVYAKGDTLVLDLDGDGKFESGYYDTPERFHLGKYFVHGKKCYELSVEPHGRALALDASDVECGYVTAPLASGSAELLSEHGALKIGGKKTLAPVGAYQFVGCRFEAKDAKGELWRIVGRGHLKQGRNIEVAANEKTHLAIGPPLTASLSVATSESYQFSLDIEGRGGEKYSADRFAIVGSKDRALPPELKIVGKDGKTLARGKFEYG